MHTHAAWDPTLADSVQLRVWVFVHLCLRSSKIKTQAYYLIRPLSSGRVWRQNGEGTMTPRRWRLTPSPTLLTAPQNMPSPTHPLAILPPSLFWPKDPPPPTPSPTPYKRTCQDGTLPPSLHAHTDAETNPPPYTAVIAPGGILPRIGDPQKTALFLPLCVSFSFLPSPFFCRTDDTMQWFTPGWALTYCRLASIGPCVAGSQRGVNCERG